MRPFIVVGDPTDHGGVVIGSTQTTDTFGKRLARVGDQVTCPKKGHGTTVIVTGDPTMIVDGAPVARHGDKCACGATLISGQVVSGVGEGGGVASSARTAQRAADATHMPKGLVSRFVPPEDPTHDMHFLVRDAETRQPLPNMPYRLLLDDGHTVTGVTDNNGLTEKIQSTGVQIAHIEVPYHGQNKSAAHADLGHDACGC